MAAGSDELSVTSEMPGGGFRAPASVLSKQSRGTVTTMTSLRMTARWVWERYGKVWRGMEGSALLHQAGFHVLPCSLLDRIAEDSAFMSMPMNEAYQPLLDTCTVIKIFLSLSMNDL